MNILNVIPSFYPKIGGSENYALNLSKYLFRRGHNVTVITSEFPNCIYYENIGGIHVIRTNILKLFSIKNNFDLCNFHGSRSLWLPFIYVYTRFYRTPLVITTHGIPPHSSKLNYFKKIIYDKTIGYITFSDSEIIATAKHEKERSIAMGAKPERISVLTNAVDLKIFNSQSDSTAFRCKYGIKESEYIILFVGRLSVYKGIPFLLHAFKNVLRDKKDVVLVFVGGPSENKTLKNTISEITKNLDISERVVFTGPLIGKDLIESYASSDVFVLSSIYEGNPSVILEAMACGKPVISTRVGSAIDIIKEGKNGYLVDYGNTQQLSQAILYLISNKKIAEAIGYNNKQYTINNFSWDRRVIEIEQLYTKLIEK